MSESYLEIQLDQEPIELCKLLKIADLVAGGGEAKVVISEGYVLLNGEVEYQKRKKVYHNDVIEFNNEVIQVIINKELADDSIQSPVDNAPSKKANSAKTPQSQSIEASHAFVEPSTKKQKKAAPITQGTASGNKRKPISF